MTDEFYPSAAPAAVPDATPSVQPDVSQTDAPAAPAEEFDPELAALPDEKVRTGLQKRFKELTDSKKEAAQRENDALRKAYEAEARAQEYERRLQASQRPVDTAELGPMPEAPQMPSLEDPGIKTMDDFNRAVEQYKKDLVSYRDNLSDWSGKKSLAEFRQRQTSEQQQREQMEQAARLAAKGRAAMQKYPDFQAVTQPFVGMADQIPELQAVVRDSDSGTDVLYHLCKNPSLLDALAKMPNAYQRGKELLRLEAELTAPQPRRQTKAPEPLSPVGGGDGNVTKLLDLTKGYDASEYVARRNRDELRRRRGN